MSSQEDMIVGASPEIPDKLYFRIGDVARLAGIKPYVLRFWETRFSQIKPMKRAGGRRPRAAPARLSVRPPGLRRRRGHLPRTMTPAADIKIVTATAGLDSGAVTANTPA